MYETAFKQIRTVVYPKRQKNKRPTYRTRWWIHVEPRPAMRKSLQALDRFIAVPRVAKHLLFVWMTAPVLPDCQLIVIARSDDYTFGVLQSRIHAVWAGRRGTQVRERESGFRYTPTTCFTTFPFPTPTEPQIARITAGAIELDRLRNAWLNPPEWTKTETLVFFGSRNSAWHRFIQDADPGGLGTVRYPYLVPKDDEAKTKLRTRTLTALYNDPPAWLQIVRKEIDEAVFAAYGWDVSLTDEEILKSVRKNGPN
jgi:hypothetical protein